MRVLVLVKADKDSEAGVLPDEKFVAEMGRFNEELVRAGVMLAAEGLYPSSKGVRVRFLNKKTSVIDGPFSETKDLIAGYWLWKVNSMAEAVEWVRRCPSPDGAQQGEIEIRPIFELEDFTANMSPEIRRQEERLRAEAERLSQADKR